MTGVGLDTDFREVLRKELERRIQRNPSYSLRAFARDLEMAPSTLSDAMRGKLGLSRLKAHGIALRLGLSTTQADYFCHLVESQSRRSGARRQAATARLAQLREDPGPLLLAKDTFDFLAEWHHLGILALLDTQGCRGDPESIAAQLGISAEAAAGSLDRLVRLGLVRSEAGCFRSVKDSTFVPSGTSPVAMRRFHADFLAKAQGSIHAQTSAERELSATIMTIPRERLDEARELIAEFRRKFTAHFGKLRGSDAVYGLGVQFFSLSQPGEMPS